MESDGYDVYAEKVDAKVRAMHVDRRVIRSVIRVPAKGSQCHAVVAGRPICNTQEAIELIAEMRWVNVRTSQRCPDCSARMTAAR